MAQRSRGSENLAARVSEFVDEHLQLLRNVSTGLVVAGAILFARSIKMTTKFKKAVDIPEEFILKNVKLRGRLLHVTEEGLEVEHIPISLPFMSSWQRRLQSNGKLLVRLAGVELTQNGKLWLHEYLKPSEMLWFQLLRRDDSVLDCFILVNRGRFFSVCLNEEVLRQGLGRAIAIEGLPQDSKRHWKFQTRLLQAELKAQKKGRGLWKEASVLEKLTKSISTNTAVQQLKRFIKWMANPFKN
ncbi:protein C3orf33 homolog isoform X1 [Microcaecilia unicolor]|uniref:Protein C3orf33 homolog isoform X1 n=1 Tax=Microcaecilia unicolor TaxID=1415580 RepID=A0A6P7X248_9AMPH|nr:protein C3orf33 homolog isoform X1 [Microcaecilia unicolor]XP_030072892.1 protein C3orf33 homolog isoform X1 [Microcaecilia unicolor]